MCPKGMDDPDEGDDAGDPAGRGPEPIAKGARFQRAANDAEERERSQDVDREVDGVVSPRVELSGCVVEGEGKLDDGPAGSEEGLQSRDIVDTLISDDLMEVIKKKGAGETVEVSDDPGRDDE